MLLVVLTSYTHWVNEQIQEQQYPSFVTVALLFLVSVSLQFRFVSVGRYGFGVNPLRDHRSEKKK